MRQKSFKWSDETGGHGIEVFIEKRFVTVTNKPFSEESRVAELPDVTDAVLELAQQYGGESSGPKAAKSIDERPLPKSVEETTPTGRAILNVLVAKMAAQVEVGERNNTLRDCVREAGKKRLHISEDDARVELIAAAVAVGLDEGKSLSTFNSAYPFGLRLSPPSAAEAFVDEPPGDDFFEQAKTSPSPPSSRSRPWPRLN